MQARKAVLEPRWEEATDELREGYAVDHLLDKFIVPRTTKADRLRLECGAELYLVACQGYGAEENSREPYHISDDLIIKFELRSRESVQLLTAQAEDEPEDEADDDELTEVDSDASEVEHVVPKTRRFSPTRSSGATKAAASGASG